MSLTEKKRRDLLTAPEWTIYEARRLAMGQLICKFSEPYLHAWIDEQSPESNWLSYWYKRRRFIPWFIKA
ncbi:unnamed protein product, partial [Rotaria sordida]